jgi:hypothetical protein
VEFFAGGGTVSYFGGGLSADLLTHCAAASGLIQLKSLRQIPVAEGAVGNGGLYASVCAAPPAYRDLQYSRNFSMCSTLPVTCPVLNMVCYTSWRRQGRQSPPNFGGWVPLNRGRPRRSSCLWRGRGSFGGHVHLDLLPGTPQHPQFGSW